MHGRFPYWASRERDIFRPSVSEYLYERGIIKPEYPDGCEFAVCVTHDIDNVFKPVSSKLFEGFIALKHGHEKVVKKKELLSLHNRKSPYFNFDQILSLEKKYDVQSTWFFQALIPGEPEFRYFLSDVESVFGDILDAEGEIGLHGGFETAYNLDQLICEKNRLEKALGQKVMGYRSHFLKFVVPETWENLAKAGFYYDSTLGYADCAGFRSGMCHPYRPVNLKTGNEINIIELPQHIMEMSIFNNYMRLDFDMGWKLVQQIIDQVHGCKGILVINWHNTSYLEGSIERKFIDKVIGYCKMKNAWMNRLDQFL